MAMFLTVAKYYQDNQIPFTSKSIRSLAVQQNEDTPQLQKWVGNSFSQASAKGYIEKIEEGFGSPWKLTEFGESLVSAIPNITIIEDKPIAGLGDLTLDPSVIRGTTTKPQNLKQKKKLPKSEIKPLELPFEPNLSHSAMNLANTLGAVLDDNQAYRDFLKATLIQLADFLSATVIFNQEEKQDGRSEKNH